MSIVFWFSGKQMEYIEGKRDIFFVDYQKNFKLGDKFNIDKILRKDGDFGQPYLEGETIRAEVLKHGLRKKITIFKYKAKKRYTKKQGFRAKYTMIKILP